MKRVMKLIKWGFIIGISYFVLTTLYFGYDDIDSEKGIFKFYWSGLQGLRKDSKFGFGFKFNEVVQTKLNGVDGPYVFGDIVFNVNKNNVFHSSIIDNSRSIKVNTSCKELPYFNVVLNNKVIIEKDNYENPSKLIAISDIEGNFTGFYSFLFANKVIDKNANWIFGNGHLVLNGDFFVRGTQVPQEIGRASCRERV